MSFAYSLVVCSVVWGAGASSIPSERMRADDKDARPFETDTLFKSFIFRDPMARLGAPFVMYYNARPPRGDETIGMAVSQDMRTWRRYGAGPVLMNPRPPGAKHGVISGVVYHFYCAVGNQGRAIALATSRPMKEIGR